MKDPIHTINVVETVEGSIYQLRSWPHDATEEAENFFKSLCSENDENWGNYSEEDIDDIMDDGFYEVGTWTVSLVHSNC